MGTTHDESYLGDGLYATFDGWQIVLRAPRGDEGDHWVALEPETFTALVRFAERINGKYNVKHFDALHGIEPKGPAGDAGQVGWMGGEHDR